jgi:NAD(P)H-dependent flavin oxidoreductase YrpB (nitropropane dioxygenase family)
MTIRTPLTERFGIDVPIFAFTYQPEVAAAVTKAGGFGVLGALRYSPEELDEALRWLEAEVDGRPYGVDIVIPAASEKVDATNADELKDKLEALIPQGHRDFVQGILDRYDVPELDEDGEEVRGVLGWTPLSAQAQIDVIFRYHPTLLANALGPPPKEVVDAAHERDITVAALVGRVDQAIAQRDVGVDIVVAQGTEAGGHTGEISTFVLVPEVVDAVAPLPVLAAGGVGDGRQIAAALALGAQGVWTGSIWLTTNEADVAKPVLDKLLHATSRDAIRSRALTGKPARQLRTAWTEAWEGPDSPGTLPMPLQYLLTAEAQRRIYQSGHPELSGMPVGQVVGMLDEVRPVSAVMSRLVSELEDAVAALDQARGKATS